MLDPLQVSHSWRDRASKKLARKRKKEKEISVATYQVQIPAMIFTK
jgi:hypothetical protein